ncbi:transcription factor E2F5-like [Gouania willdenowi]|uniref:Transcription factor E2F5-like n=1 Tax=Gouania willdenowi TaxID=441366 RepID=A0A8C5DM94_GOUWI|nr:transcription factor E2F5-like [Gouania willdenowi]
MEFEGRTRSRHEKSLGVLTMKFVSLIQQAEDGVLDLKAAADTLAVKEKQKRRIYDITNVLEGVGLIQKRNKNIIQWRGENNGSRSQDVIQEVNALKAQISKLEVQEKELDDQKAWIEANIKHLRQDSLNKTYNFVTHEDICSAFYGDTVLAVEAPPATQLEVPLPEKSQIGQKKYQMSLCSPSAPIRVTLIYMDSDSRVPVVFPVPPTDNICLSVPCPPDSPPNLQKIPLSLYTCSSSSCSQDSLSSHHQVVLSDHNDVLTTSSASTDLHMECSSQALGHHQQQMDLTDSGFHSELDMSSLLRLNTDEEYIKAQREEAVDLIDELVSTGGGEYSFNLEDNERVCDLFNMQMLNY